MAIEPSPDLRSAGSLGSASETDDDNSTAIFTSPASSSRTTFDVLREVDTRLHAAGIVRSALARQCEADEQQNLLRRRGDLPISSWPRFFESADALERAMLQAFVRTVVLPRDDIDTKKAMILSMFPMREGETPEAHWTRFNQTWSSIASRTTDPR